MATAAEKISERGYVRAKLTRTLSNIHSTVSKMSPINRTTSTVALKALQEQLNDLNKVVYTLKESEGATEDDLEDLVLKDMEYDDKILVGLHTLSGQSAAIPAAGITNVAPAPAPSKIPLPKLDLPKFSNEKGESLRKFLDTFEAILGKSGSGDRELFLYLRNQLSGGPRTLIDSLESCQETYTEAKKLLEEAFDCTASNKYNLVQRLRELKLGTATDPYAYVGEIRSIMAAMKSNNITVEDIQQYFIWASMNNDFQSHMIAATGKIKPSLQEIMGSLFDTVERYQRERCSKEKRSVFRAGLC